MTALDSLIASHNAVELALVALALFVLPTLSVFYGLRTARERGPTSKQLIGRYIQTLLRGSAIAIVVLVAWKFAGRSFDDLGLGWPPSYLEFIAIGFALACVAALALQTTFGFKPSAKDISGWKRQLDALKLAPRDATELAMFVLVAITAGVWEELFYRGFLMWFFMPTTGVMGAVLITSIIFGVGHAYQGWVGVVRTTVVGALFGVGYALTGSLWWLMILHAAIDVFAGVLAFRVYSMQRDT